MRSQNATLFKDQTDQFVLYAIGLFGFQGRAPDELARGRFPCNAQAMLEANGETS